MHEKPWLKIIQGPNKGAEIRISKNELVLGRDSSSDYSIPNEKISRRHIRVFLNTRWMLEDLGSKNHTRLNSIKIEPGQAVVLNDEDRIQLATQVILSFHDPDTTMSETVSHVITNGLWLNFDNEDVFIDNKLLIPKLSKRHFAILAFLYAKSKTNNPIASNEDIAAVVWANEYGINHQMIDSEIYRLRKRLEKFETKHSFIKSIRDRGRKFVQKI